MKGIKRVFAILSVLFVIVGMCTGADKGNVLVTNAVKYFHNEKCRKVKELHWQCEIVQLTDEFFPRI